MLEVSYIQGKPAQCLRQAAGTVLALACAAWLGGCQGKSVVGSGEDLFHGLEGGVIAQQRPPPPGVNDPYPNLGSIPKRPPAPDIIAEQKLADQLAAQRDQAELAAAANPLTIVPPTAPPAPKKLAAPPDPNANRVVVDAAPAPPPPPPSAPKATTPAPTQAAAASPESGVLSLASVPAVTSAVVSGPLPPFATEPPAGPTGMNLPVTTVSPPAPAPVQTAAAAPTTSLAPPAAVPQATSEKSLFDTLFSKDAVPGPKANDIVKIDPPSAGNTVAVDFTPGSATLPPSATLNLRRFALAHRGAGVTITGHGEAVLNSVDSQSRALDLALRRAQAIAGSLATAGVSAANLHVHAEATGNGGSASL